MFSNKKELIWYIVGHLSLYVIPQITKLVLLVHELDKLGQKVRI